MAAWYRWDGDALILDIHVQPRASHDAVAGPHGERLKIRISAPPVDGKANQHLIGFLARLCAVPRSRVELVRGGSGRDKRVRITRPAKLPPGVEAADL